MGRASVWMPLLTLVVLTVLGCAEDREKVLIGTWETSELFTPAMALKLKEGAPAGVNPTSAATALKGTEMRVHANKTFQLGLLGHLAEGTWTFDKSSGEMRLNVASVRSLVGTVSQFQPGVWVANLDPDNLRLRVVPLSPEQAALAKSAGGGGLTDGIPLRKAQP